MSITRIYAITSNDCNSCLYLFLNISNCLNCNAYINPLISNNYIKSNYNLFYLIEEKYKPKGSQIISEYLGIKVPESSIVYNDSLISSVKAGTGSGSGILYSNDDYEIIFDIKNINSIIEHLNKNLDSLVRIDTFLKNKTLSHQLFLKIIDGDTFVIDQTLGNIYKNGYKLNSKMYLWDIPGLLPKDHIVKDSANVIYKIEIDNIRKIDSFYLVFCSGNQLFMDTEDKNNIELYPRTFILQINTSDLDSFSNYTVVMLSDERGCYFDDYSIYEIGEHCYLTSECGNNNLKPKLSLISINKGKVVVNRSKLISLNSELRNCVGYTSDLGKDIIYFIGVTKIYGFQEKGPSIVELFDFTKNLYGKDYIAGTTNLAFPDYKILINSEKSYILINNISFSSNGDPEYKIKYKKETLGNMISNCIYNNLSKEFSFINKSGYYISLSIL